MALHIEMSNLSKKSKRDKVISEEAWIKLRTTSLHVII